MYVNLIGDVKMKSVILVTIFLVVFQSNAQASTDPSIPTFITSDQVLTPGWTKPVSPYDTQPHKMTGESMIRINGTNTLTSHTMKVTQPNLDACIGAMKRFVSDTNAMGDIVSPVATNTKRKAYCTPALQGAE